MFIYTFLLRMTDTMTSQNIDLSSWDTLYTFASVTETCEHLGSHNAEKLTTLGSVFLEGLRMTD